MKIKYVCVSILLCALLPIGGISCADEVRFTKPYILGKGTLSFVCTSGDSHYETLIYGDNSIGSVFAIDPYQLDGSFELRITIPSSMWSGSLIIPPEAYFDGELSVGKVVPSKFLSSSVSLGSERSGSFTIGELHRRSDGIVDRFEGRFTETGLHDGVMIWQEGEIQFEIPCVPEPRSTTLIVLAILATIWSKYR